MGNKFDMVCNMPIMMEITVSMLRLDANRDKNQFWRTFEVIQNSCVISTLCGHLLSPKISFFWKYSTYGPLAGSYLIHRSGLQMFSQIGAINPRNQLN